MEALKLWFTNVALAKMAPSLIRAALAWVLTLLAAHAGALSVFGVIYDKAAQTITLHLDTLQTYLIGGGLGLLTAALTAAQHHTVAAIEDKPQTGEHHRAEDSQKPE